MVGGTQCIHVVDSIFSLLAQSQLNTADGLFALSVAVARSVQQQFDDVTQRESMIHALAQIMINEANDLDQHALAAGASNAAALKAA